MLLPQSSDRATSTTFTSKPRSWISSAHPWREFPLRFGQWQHLTDRKYSKLWHKDRIPTGETKSQNCKLSLAREEQTAISCNFTSLMLCATQIIISSTSGKHARAGLGGRKQFCGKCNLWRLACDEVRQLRFAMIILPFEHYSPQEKLRCPGIRPPTWEIVARDLLLWRPLQMISAPARLLLQSVAPELMLMILQWCCSLTVQRQWAETMQAQAKDPFNIAQTNPTMQVYLSWQSGFII